MPSPLQYPPMPDPNQPPPGAVQAAPLSGVDPAIVRRLADAYGLDDETAALMLQMHRAQALTGRGLPQGRQTGDVYTAASPLEMAAGGYREALGLREMRRAQLRANALGPRRVRDARAAYELYGSPPLTDPETADYDRDGD